MTISFRPLGLCPLKYHRPPEKTFGGRCRSREARREFALLPGQLEAAAAALSAKHGGLLFTPAEIDALAEIAKESNFKFDTASLKSVDI